MAITKSAKKAARSSLKKRVYNLRNLSAMRASTKDVRKLAAAKNIDEAQKKLAEAYKAIDKAAKRGTIKKNAAARKKSRLAKVIKKASGK